MIPLLVKQHVDCPQLIELYETLGIDRSSWVDTHTCESCKFSNDMDRTGEFVECKFDERDEPCNIVGWDDIDDPFYDEFDRYPTDEERKLISDVIGNNFESVSETITWAIDNLVETKKITP